MKRGYEKGGITVFLSLILLVLMSIICQVVEEAVYQADRLKTVSSTEVAFQGLLGEYNLELLENYGLFFLDGADEKGNLSKEKLISQLDYYLYRNIENTGGMQQMKILEEKLTSYALATDQNGQPYYKQVVEAYKPLLGKLVIEEAQEFLKNYKSGKISRETMEKSKVSKEDLKIPEDIEVDKEAKKKAEEIENPIDVIEDIKKGKPSDTFSLQKVISTNRIDLTKTIEHRKLNVGNYKESSKDTAGDEIIFNLYLKDTFTNFQNVLGVENTTGLLYQQEYIVGGKGSDIENLNVVIAKIMWIREGVNFVYLLTDKVKLAEAEMLALSLVGYTGIAPLITATKLAILAVWAYGESMIEMAILLSGGRVSFVKTSENWHLSLKQLANVKDTLQTIEAGETQGMSYEDYLWIFLCAVPMKERCYRSMDLIEQNIQRITQNKDFQMDKCVSYIGAEISIASRTGRTIKIEKGMGY